MGTSKRQQEVRATRGQMRSRGSAVVDALIVESPRPMPCFRLVSLIRWWTSPMTVFAGREVRVTQHH
jgi:hypothetical protein